MSKSLAGGGEALPPSPTYIYVYIYIYIYIYICISKFITSCLIRPNDGRSISRNSSINILLHDVINLLHIYVKTYIVYIDVDILYIKTFIYNTYIKMF